MLTKDFKWITRADIKHHGKRLGEPTLTVMGKNCGYTIRLNSVAKEIRGFREDEFVVVGINDKKIVIKITKDTDKGLNIIREPFGFSVSSKFIYLNLKESGFPVPCHIPITYDAELEQWEGLRENAKKYTPIQKIR